MNSERLTDRNLADFAYRRAMFRALLLLTVAGGVLFGYLNISQGIPALGYVELVLVAYSLGIFAASRRARNLKGWILAFLVPFFSIMMFALAHPDSSPKVFIWVLLIPLVTHLLVGRSLGIALSVAVVLVAAGIYVWRFREDPLLFNALDLANMGVCTLTVLIFSHVYEVTRERSEARLRKLATTDSLTGLANRTRFSDVFTWERNKALRENYPLSLILIDLDHFKSINDSYGHEAGDLVLKHVADLITGRLRATDLLCRMGGEEFAIMVSNVNLSQVEQLTRELQRLVGETPCVVDGAQLRVTFSAGIAQLRIDGQDLRSLFSVADRRMYQSKAEGRNRITSVDDPGFQSTPEAKPGAIDNSVAAE